MRSLCSLLLLLAVLLALVGCGGGGHSAASVARGSATIQIVWPNARAVPLNAGVVVVTLKRQGDTESVTQTLAKSLATTGQQTVSSQTFGSLKVGNYTVTAEAFAASTPTGAALATGSSILSVVAGEDSRFIVTMGTTLVRYKIVETDGSSAFDSQEFFLDANGVHTASGAKVTFNALSTAAAIALTPQSEGGDLLLVNPAVIDLFKLTLGGGFSFTDGTTTNAISGSVNLKYIPSSTSTGTFRIDYQDYEDGALTPLSSFAGTVEVKSPQADTTFTVGGLPAKFGPNRYQLVATLKEADIVGIADSGATYSVTSSTPTASSNPVTCPLTFPQVVNRGRDFTLSLTLEVKTQNGGYVDLTNKPPVTAKLEDLATTVNLVGGDFLSLAIPSSAGSVVYNELSFRRSTANTPITGTVVQIDALIAGAPVALDPTLFEPGTLPTDTSPSTTTALRKALMRPDSTKLWTIAATSTALYGQMVLTSYPLTWSLGPKTVAGAVAVTLTPNAGNIPIGVN